MNTTFIKTLKAEFIKIKRSKILTLGTIIGFILPFLFIAVNIFEAEFAAKPVPNGRLYFTTLFDTLLQALAGFFLPLLIIITASKIAQLDHKNKGWQLMETQPVSKLSIFFSKYLILVLNVFKTLIIYTLSVLFFGWIYTLIHDIHENYSLQIDFSHFGYVLLRIFISALAIVSLQYVISVLISNFIWSLVLGFAMLLSLLLLQDAGISLRWFPYNSLLVTGSNPSGSQIGHFLLKAEWLSIVDSIIFLFVGYNWYRFKGLINAFIKKPKRLLISSLFLIVGLSVSYLLAKTVTSDTFDKTVIKGQLKTDKSISSIYLIEPVTQDTIASIPVENDSFRYVIQRELPANNYYLIFGKYHRDQLFMCSNDSIQLTYNQYGTESGSIYVTGTRITENQQGFYGGDWSYVSYLLDSNSRLNEPNYYIEQIIDDYYDDLNRLSSKVSVDHLVARSDFLNISRQIIAVRYANYWKDYLKKKELYHPEIKVETNPEIQELLSSIELQNESLLGNQSYVDFITKELETKRKDSTQTVLDLISQTSNSSFKDKWLFKTLTSDLQAETINSKRDSLFSKYVRSISNEKLQRLTSEIKNKLNKLNIGEPAIDFVSYDNKGNTYSLADFKGKFVMIDTWASWCGPCKYQEPFYIRKQQKYKNKNIIFASINVDTKENKWHEDLVEMNQDVLQLRAKDIDSYMSSYGINSIPRFILIAPDGTIANSEFTFPSNKNFDLLLDAALEKQYDL